MRPIWILLLVLVVLESAQCDEESRAARRAARRRERQRRRLMRMGALTTTTEAPEATTEEETLVTVQAINFEMLLQAARANRNRNYSSNNEEEGSASSDEEDDDVGGEDVVWDGEELYNRSSAEIRVDPYHYVSEEDRPPLTPSQWRARVRRKQVRVVSIQLQILAQLGFAETPNVSIIVPQEQDRLMGIYDRYANNRQPVHDGDIERLDSYLPTSDVAWATSGAWGTSTRMRLFFDPNLEEDTRITSAVLSLYKRPSSEHRESNVLHGENVAGDGAGETYLIDEGHIRVTVYKYMEQVQGNHDDRREDRSLVISTTIRRSRDGWIQLDVLEAVQQWKDDPDSNYGLAVTVENDDGEELQPGSVFGQADCHQEDSSSESTTVEESDCETSINATYRNLTSPHLDIITVESTSREKRDTESDQSSSSCRLERLELVFDDMGWNFVVQPAKFQTGFCTGTCRESGSTINRFQTDCDGSCCRPTHTEGLDMLVFENSNSIILKHFPDLIVTECGCTP